MPEGLVRSGDFRNGTPVTLPLNFGTPITEPHSFGNPVPPTDATFNSNPVTWVPSPAHFGNVIAPATTPLAAPTFSPAGGAYTGAQSVTLTVDAHATATYYTTNGSAPTVLSTLYTGAITTVGSGTEVINAFSHGTGAYTDSTVATATYVITAVTPALVAAGVVVSPGHTVTLNTTGATLLVAILTGGGAVPTVSDSVGGHTNAWTYLATQTSSGNYTRLAYAYAATGGGALNTGGSHVITVTNTADTTSACVVFAFGNTSTTSSVLNASNGAQQQAGTPVTIYTLQAGSITPAAGSVVVMGFGSNDTIYADSTIPTGFTGELKQTNGSSLEIVGGCYKLNDAGSAENPSWTVETNNYTGVVIAAFK